VVAANALVATAAVASLLMHFDRDGAASGNRAFAADGPSVGVAYESASFRLGVWWATKARARNALQITSWLSTFCTGEFEFGVRTQVLPCKGV
jgi:hypothetical protein